MMDINKLLGNIRGKIPLLLVQTGSNSNRLFYALILAILSLSVISARVDLKLGKPSPRRIVTEWNAIDIYATERLQEEVAREVAESYDYDPAVLVHTEEQVAAFFQNVRTIRSLPVDDEEKINRLLAIEDIEMTEQLAGSLLTARNSDLNEMQQQLMEVLQAILQQGVKPGGLETARRQALQEISFLIFEQDQKRVMVRLAEAVIEPNMIYNAAATNKARKLPGRR